MRGWRGWLLLILFIPSAEAAFDLDFTGARGAGMGFSSAALETDIGGIYTNPAAITSIRSQQLMLSAMSVLPSVLGGGVYQTAAGYGGFRSGVGMGFLWLQLEAKGLYSETVLLACLGRRMGRLGVGASIGLMGWDTSPTFDPEGRMVEDVEGRTVISAGLGFRFDPYPNTSLALSLLNLNRPDIASEGSPSPERLPVIGRLGVAVYGPKTAWGMDLVFERSEIDVRTGFEREITGSLKVRLGFRLENLAMGVSLTGGLGYRLNESVRVDYAFVLPMINLSGGVGSHCGGIVYEF
ncbi:hypothetical protein DRP77_04205 [Candidatus Poribacteria bacterium]|nr:MAG: hypothetical protein DRP77_04205 [Candidatus Poribacteria bacterium]